MRSRNKNGPLFIRSSNRRICRIFSPPRALFVVGSDKDGAMGLSARDAGCVMRAAMTLAPELKTIGDFSAFLLSELTAIGAGLSIGTDRFSLGNADIEGFNSIFLC